MYRITYLDGATGCRNHRDYKTLKGALKFYAYCGGADCCTISKWNEQTHYYEEFEPEV